MIDKGFPVIYSPIHFSHLCGYDYGFIFSVSNNSHRYYKQYEIPKKNGGHRIIHEPYPSLKEIQKWLLEEILSKAQISPAAKAYVVGRNIRDNARFHRGQEVVIKLDIVDFFGNITYNHVYDVFRKMGYTKPLAVILSNLCIHHNKLPQGSPASPMLSNIVLYDIDKAILSYCQHHNIRYTRYADDLTFSGKGVTIGRLIYRVEKILANQGFELNKQKTQILFRNRCQCVTGVVVNERLQVSRQYRKDIRQSVFYVMKYGLDDHLKFIKYEGEPINYIYKLLGKISFALSINPKDAEINKYTMFLHDLLKQLKST